MKVTEKDVASIAELASLELTIAERERMVHDLNQVLDYIDILNEADTSLSPSNDSADPAPPIAQTLRDDQTAPSLPRTDALKNAPQSDGIYFQVPKVIER